MANEKPNERFYERDQPIMTSQLRHNFTYKTWRPNAKVPLVKTVVWFLIMRTTNVLFQAKAKTSVIFKELRYLLADMLQHKLEDPCLDLKGNLRHR